MGLFMKVLFFSNGARGEQGALLRTCRTAARTGAEVTVLGVVDEVSTNDPLLQRNINRIQKTLIREREAELDELIDSLGGVEGPRPKVNRVVVPGRDYIEAVRFARQGRFELLVSAAKSEDSITGALFGSTDLRVIHYADCPVLVLKSSRRRKLGNILVAIDPHGSAGQGISLNDRLLKVSATLAEQEGASLHLLHVHEKLGKGEDIAALEAARKAEAVTKLRALASPYDDIHEHVSKGKPASVIMKFVRDNDIDLLVMGNVARSGVPGLLVGNTAERVLGHVDCSVLVIKPDDWQSPLV